MAGLAPAPASSSEELVDVVQAVESAPDTDELPLPLFGGVRRGHPPELHEAERQLRGRGSYSRVG